MSRERKNETKLNFEDEAVESFLMDSEFDEDEFFERFEPKQANQRKKAIRRRDARRRIEEYWDDRRLEDSLDEYYYHSDD